MEPESALPTDKRPGVGEAGFQTEKILALSLAHFIRDVYSSFLVRSAVVVVVGFTADRIGLNATYLISAAMGLVGIPFILMLPKK